MQIRLTKQQRRKKINKIEELLSKLSVDRVIVDWKKWNSFTFQQREKIKKEWDLYYNLVEMSESKARFLEMKEAFDRNDRQKIKELKAQAELALSKKDFIKKPFFTDPYEFMYGAKVSDYKLLTMRLDELKKEDYGSDESILS